MECKYCKNIFQTKSSLNYHQANAKYCLALRKQINENLLCKGCNKSFSSKHWLEKHMEKCVILVQNISKENLTLKEENKFLKQQCNEKEKLLLEKDNIIKELQDKLENIALKAVSRPTTTKNTQINNYIQKLECITDQHFQDQVQYLTIDHIQKGPEGYAEYALEYPLKNRIVCVDYSRRKVKFKDKDGKVVTDPEMSTIATKLFQSIKDKNKDLIMSYGNELRDKFGDEMETVIELLGYKSGVDDGAGGSKSEFFHDFVKSVCGKSVME